MITIVEESGERIVEIVETWDGKVGRTFYCIYDPEFGHWMSDEPFEGLLWTKDFDGRQEFESREEAEMELDRLQEWREERESGDLMDEIPLEETPHDHRASLSPECESLLAEFSGEDGDQSGGADVPGERLRPAGRGRPPKAPGRRPDRPGDGRLSARPAAA